MDVTQSKKECLMNSGYKQAIKKYRTSCTILGIILISLWVLYSLCIGDSIGMLLFLIIYLIIIRISVVIIAKKTLFPILYDNLNAIEFQKIVDNRYFLPPLSYRINAAFFTGDYQTAVNIATYQLHKKKCSTNAKLFYLSLLARTYFELRDFDKLNLLLKKYDEIRELYPSKKLDTADSIWNYYRYFLNGNFEACKTFCREKHLELNSKTWDAKIRKLNNDFAYAVACYENGDTNDAIEYFESIISYAPYMHSSELSARYVEAIKTNSKMTLLSEIVSKNDFQPYDDRTTKKIQRHRIVTIVLLTLVCVCIIASEVISLVINQKQNQYDSENNSAIVEFEKNLSNAIAMNYDKANFITYFNVTDGAQHIDSFCLIEHGDGLDLTSIVTYDGGKSLDLIILIEDIQIPNDYSVKSAVSNNQIEFYISNEQLPTSIDKELIEFSFNNRNYWIEIQSITPLT